MRKTKYWKILGLLAPLLIGLPLLTLPFFNRGGNLPPEIRMEMLRGSIFSNILLILIFYLHTYLIYPLREKKNGMLIYIGLLLSCLAVFMLASNLLMPDMPRFHPKDFPRPPDMGRGGRSPGFLHIPFLGMLPFLFVILASFSYRLYTDKVQRDKLIKERENIHLKTELEFLSSQISPHFMFNILNTLVSMARKKSELLEPSLINLSQLMRYMLYDTNGGQISLSDEIDYLRNYINLQLLRFGDSVKIVFFFNGSFPGNTIAPMLLIPFVENAFKHGIGTLEDPVIDISIEVTPEKVLKMKVLNGISSPANSAVRDSGIGLTNVRRRLELLYPSRHQLHIEEKDGTFTAQLEINLQP